MTARVGDGMARLVSLGLFPMATGKEFSRSSPAQAGERTEARSEIIFPFPLRHSRAVLNFEFLLKQSGFSDILMARELLDECSSVEGVKDLEQQRSHLCVTLNS
jgi:hypothetical protein